MRIVTNRLIALILALALPSGVVFGASDPPPPSTPPPPPGLPIDGSLYVLLVISLIFGIYKVYKYHSIKKASN
ncbi:PID-CTERM protein-sorting domain-containing protein [Flavobacterium sp.]